MAYENMIIIDETQKIKYPVMVDPEGQALRYMSVNMGDSNIETTGYAAQ